MKRKNQHGQLRRKPLRYGSIKRKWATEKFKLMVKDARKKKQWNKFREEVTADRVLHKFWKLHRAMNNKIQ